MTKESNQIHSFSDFVDNKEQPLDGEKVKIDTILNKSITILNFKIRKSKYEDNNLHYVTVQFKDEDENIPKIFFSGSNVIIDLLNKYEDKIPFKTVIKRIDRYYTLT